MGYAYKESERIVKRFSGILKLFTRDVALYIALGVLSAMMAAGANRMFQILLDGFAARSMEAAQLALYAVMVLAPCVGYYLMNVPEQRLQNGIYLEIKIRALEKMRTIALDEWQKTGMGELIQRVENGAQAGRNMLFDFYLRIAAELAPQMAFSAGFIALVDRQVFLWVALGYIGVFVFSNLLLKSLYRIKRSILDNEEQFSARLVRGFMELVVFRLGGRFLPEINRARASARAICSARTRMTMVHEAFFTAFALLVGAMKVGILGYAYFAGGLSVGQAVALIALLDGAYQPVAVFNVLFVQFKLDKMGYARLEAFMNAQDTPGLLGGATPNVVDGRVSIEDAGCAYGEKWVYRHLNLSISSGASVGLVGPSGSGKSSLIKQITGLTPLAGGRIEVGGADVSKVNLEKFYAYLSYTPQEPPVFDGTVRENILLEGEAGEAALWQALDKVELADTVRRMPQGLDTPIGEKGAALSGGERQRLALARLFFLRDERLVILDEATSNLDNPTEERVMGRLLNHLKGRTLICIAHRLSCLRNFDEVVLLQEGKIAGQGSFEQMERENAGFQALLRKERERRD